MTACATASVTASVTDHAYGLYRVHLPAEIWSHIYSYDPTYWKYFREEVLPYVSSLAYMRQWNDRHDDRVQEVHFSTGSHDYWRTHWERQAGTGTEFDVIVHAHYMRPEVYTNSEEPPSMRLHESVAHVIIETCHGEEDFAIFTDRRALLSRDHVGGARMRMLSTKDKKIKKLLAGRYKNMSYFHRFPPETSDAEM